MIVDHRTYTIKHGQTKAYIELFEQYGLPVQTKHLGNFIGYFETAIGPLNQVVHLWGYDSLADMEQKRAARDADPGWAEYQAKTDGLVQAQENSLTTPAPFSPIK